jgi:hypothetical protein
VADDDEDSKPWWKHPGVIAALITGVLAIVGSVVTKVLDSDGGGGSSIRGVEATLVSDVEGFRLQCPFTIAFTGTISVSGGSGEVAYRFVHVDAVGGTEQREAIQRVSFDGAGSASVRHEWTPTIPEGEVFRTAAIEVLNPVSTRSNDVMVAGLCDPTQPNGPTTPPPDVQPPAG